MQGLCVRRDAVVTSGHSEAIVWLEIGAGQHLEILTGWISAPTCDMRTSIVRNRPRNAEVKHTVYITKKSGGPSTAHMASNDLTTFMMRLFCQKSNGVDGVRDKKMV